MTAMTPNSGNCVHNFLLVLSNPKRKTLTCRDCGYVLQVEYAENAGR